MKGKHEGDEGAKKRAKFWREKQDGEAGWRSMRE